MQGEGPLRRYFASLGAGKIALWCYLIWYLGVAYLYFDPSVAIWLNAVGISAVVGVALILSVAGPVKADRWQTFRLFAMPFCVSSYSALIKGHGFLLIFPPNMGQLAALSGCCVVFASIVLTFKRVARGMAPDNSFKPNALRGSNLQG